MFLSMKRLLLNTSTYGASLQLGDLCTPVEGDNLGDSNVLMQLLAAMLLLRVALLPPLRSGSCFVSRLFGDVIYNFHAHLLLA